MKKLLIIFLLIINLFVLLLFTKNKKETLKTLDLKVSSKIKLPSYFTIKIHPSGSSKDSSEGIINEYFDDDKRKKSKVFVKNGLFCDYKNNLIDTFNNIGCDSGLDIDGNYSKYVMDYLGNIYMNLSDKQIKHSCFLAGKNVADAGWFRFNKGRLINIIHDSGHYRPIWINTLQIVIKLFEKGINEIYLSSHYNDFLGFKKIVVKRFIRKTRFKKADNLFDINFIKNIYFSA